MPDRCLYLSPLDSTIEEFYSKIDSKKLWEDSGVDLYFPADIICEPKKKTLVKLGVAAAVYNSGDDLETSSSKPYYLYPRSSIGKTPLRMANSVGIIDLQYRGELCVQVDNISDEPYNIKRGQRLFQICSQDLEPFKSVELIKDLPITKRGKNGLGSTGK